MENLGLMGTPQESAKTPSWIFPAVDTLAFVCCLILVGFHYSWLENSWDNSHCGVNSGAYYGYACKGIDAFGYTNSRMQGPLLFHPSGEGLFLPYTNHPGTIYAIIYPCYRFLGRDEAALRIPMLAILILNLLIFRFGMAPIIGRLAASAATIGFASLPMILQFGKMVDIPLFCLAFFVPTVVSWLRYRQVQTKRSWILFATIAFVAGLFDWFSYFLLPGIWLETLLSKNTVKSRCRLWLRAALPFGLSFVLVFSWLLWAEGSWDRMAATLEGLGRAIGVSGSAPGPQLHVEKVSWREWWHSITTNAGYTFTIPFLSLSALGLIATLGTAQFRNKVLRPGLVLLVAGFLPCLAFRTHASRHEFWPMVGCAGLALFFGQGVRAFLLWCTRLRIPGAPAVLILLLSIASFGFVRGFAFREARKGSHDQKQTAIEMNEEFGPTDIVFSSDSLSPSRFYRNFVTIPKVVDPTFMRLTLKRIQEHRGQFKRAFLLWNKSTTADWRWLTDVPTKGDLVEVTYGNTQYYKREFDIDRLWDF